MELSNRKIIENLSALRTVSNKQLPIKASYAIAKNINKIEEELKIFRKEKEKLINKYGQKNNNGKLAIDDKGKIELADAEGYNKDLNELLDIKTDIDIHKFKLDIINNVQFSPLEIQAIECMIEE
ncbi:hypothetical protein BJV85_002116 [Clostridium acetobutylicum]|uniref:Uncharacterized protein n=1 Tax=Clostridium acetobutylicum (strain ATCC 824 / DSM 792 / JCM 1419 / IAM 19013 / LMG 5710 / NBRC 13948 / NRRL B-527 / VKM B-1787 / 2291 / W) TaxID=272562 RepID=Q97HX6_CLOAB|nr:MULTISPECIES: DUF1617 family protein [Clostridium]AAK79844.1 Hypothetical protein, CF-35 family [Clostridium acetobutylicum ATCC 824]ADZ20930.1 conserved hypothetical protein [Clostridium acetobutylicum EA 2018]AEI32021.1 hypothetical protein SMB_G1905 [Clostridium acetobutylicum DSM 1731]AWV79726.1 DUF1617 family protein [Clostridium acetobutylicum]MBC2394296.1 DUF1617 family protein [Clostridium acetobutylicum]